MRVMSAGTVSELSYEKGKLMKEKGSPGSISR